MRAKLGSDDEFAGGIQGKLGKMALEYVKYMYWEHNRAHDAESEFTAYNAGHVLKTTAKREWAFVVGSYGVDMVTWVFDLDRAEPEYTAADMVEGRNATPLRLLMQLPMVKKAGLCVAEVVAMRLYTGPCYSRYNRVLRNQAAAGDTLFAATIHLIRRLFLFLFLLLFRFVVLCVGGAFCCSRFFADVLCILSVSTPHSAQFKIAAITPPPPDLTLYRGTGNMALGPDFFERDEQGCAGGVELAFMSATPDRNVAMGYAGAADVEAGKDPSKDLPTLYVIVVGKTAIGAKIAELSQFKGEIEYVYPPLTLLEMVSEAELSPDGKFSKIHLRLTVNQRSTTVEDAEQARRRFLVRHVNSLLWSLRNWARQHEGLVQRLGP